MGKRLLQAAILTFIIQLLASMSSPTTIQANSATNLQLKQKQVAVLIQRLGLLSSRKFLKLSHFENRITQSLHHSQQGLKNQVSLRKI